MKRLASLLAVWISTANAAGADSLAYRNDFEGPVGTEWSSAVTDVTPSGRRFLGQFGGETVSLSLHGLGAHTALTVAFDLFVLNTWDGNTGSSSGVPDSWTLAVRGGPTLLHTTFSNNIPHDPSHFQAFPDAFPGGNHAPRTGAAEVDSLGYVAGGHGSAVYELTFSFPHAADTVVFDFSAVLTTGFGPSPISDESWGIDDLVVQTTPIPEPGTLALALAALVIGVALRRR